MIGHNGGPTMEAGFGFRRLAWKKARTELIPKLPLEIVRLRVARAKRLGLDYKTYASIRATSGRDVVAFLFSGNALEISPRRIHVSAEVAGRLEGLEGAAKRLAAVYRPQSAPVVISANPEALDAGCQAPAMTMPWGQMRAELRGFAHDQGLPPDGVVLVAATAIEREWAGAADLAGIIPVERFFDQPA